MATNEDITMAVDTGPAEMNGQIPTKTRPPKRAASQVTGHEHCHQHQLNTATRPRNGYSQPSQIDISSRRRSRFSKRLRGGRSGTGSARVELWVGPREANPAPRVLYDPGTLVESWSA